jgi:hypothetical protein
MQLRQVFEDLEDFVAAYRGKISREGLLLHSETLYPKGTVLEVEIGLADELVLIRGTAGVVRLGERATDTATEQVAVLEFLDLEDDSVSFIERLTDRFESEGIAPFRLADQVDRWRRPTGPIRYSESPQGGETAVPSSTAHRADREAVGGAPAASDSARPRKAGRRLRLALLVAGLLLLAAAAVALALRPQLMNALPWSSTARTEATTAEPIVASAVPAPTVEVETQTPPPRQSPTAPSELANRVLQVSWQDTELASVVTLEANGLVDPQSVKHFRMVGSPGPRLVLYLDGFDPSDLSYRTQVDGPRLSSIRVWHHGDKSQLHIVFDLTGPSVTASDPIVEANQVTVRLEQARDGE